MRHYVLAALPALLIAVTAQAANFAETKITAHDPAAGASFGNIVAISGTTAIVASNGTGQGAVYLFDTRTGKQTARLTPGDTIDAMDNEMFGASAAVSGTTAIIGATWGRGDDPGHEPQGSAYLFDTITGKQTAKLTAIDTVRTFIGGSVAISGTTAIVGAPGFNNTPSAVYLFDTTTGKQTGKLVSSDSTENDAFGFTLAISGTIAIVGAKLHDDDNGAAYLFDTTTGAQLAKLTPSDAVKKDYFGASVAISGTTAIIGAYGTSDNGLLNSGAAYLVHLD